MKNNKSMILEILKKCSKSLNDKKADNIKLIDFNGSSSITDYCLIASGNSEPHIKALNSTILKLFNDLNLNDFKSEYFENSGWFIIDNFNFMIHILSIDMRNNYNLEGLWLKEKVKEIII